jgi:hypothetical protein
MLNLIITLKVKNFLIFPHLTAKCFAHLITKDLLKIQFTIKYPHLKCLAKEG